LISLSAASAQSTPPNFATGKLLFSEPQHDQLLGSAF